MTAEVVKSEQAGDFAVAVGDEEEEGVGAEEGVEGLLEGVVIADIIEAGVEDVGDAAGVSDVKVVEMGGVDATDQAAFVVFDRKVREAGAIEAVESERSEDFVGVDVNDF